jgi:hypothetical protein
MWNDFHRWFDANAGFPATPALDDEQPWPDPSLTGSDQTATQPPRLGPPQLPLPREFARQFNKAGFDIRDYIVYLARDQHRFRPKGLHTGSENWNAQWRQFFKGRKNASPDEIIEQLNIMLNQIPR